MTYSYAILKELGEVGEKSVNLVMWGNQQAKIDVRQWLRDETGELTPCKGICLTKEEAKELVGILAEYLYS